MSYQDANVHIRRDKRYYSNINAGNAAARTAVIPVIQYLYFMHLLLISCRSHQDSPHAAAAACTLQCAVVCCYVLLTQIPHVGLDTR